MDPYKILGVNPGASSQEITKAYTEMIKRYRSDRFADTVLQEVAQQKLQEVEQAYLVLIGKNMDESPGLRDELSGEQTGSGEINTYQQIRRLIQLGRLEQAETILSDSEAKTAQWYYLSGIILWKKGWYSEGRSYIQQAVNMEPQNREYNETLNRIMRAYYPFHNITGYSKSSAFDLCNCRALLHCNNFLLKCICRDK
ncbi:MAG: DnaJ domain-containing protein [Clostridiales bacterium]|nr:DnaJ domain-containing protein [Clostridiales bacterium]